MLVPNGDAPDGRLRDGPSSDLVVVDERAIAATMPAPNISSLNVTNSSKVQIGPKFVSVTQNVHNKEMLKGRILGLDLVSSKYARRLRCSVAVFVCWAFLVASGLALYIIYVALSKEQIRLDLGITEDWFLRRRDWQAMQSYGETFLRLPVPYVIIGHSAGTYCNQKYRCIEQVLHIQQTHLTLKLWDIGPNFLVGGNGFVFEGRGANVHSAMVGSWNGKSITIMFLGSYGHDMPDEAQFNNTNFLLNSLVQHGVLRRDYTLYGHCQIRPMTISPGINIVRELSRFANWNPTNTSGCLLGG